METIRIRKETKEALKKFRAHPRDTCDEVIARIIACRTDKDPIREDTLEAIEKGLADIRKGKTRELSEFCDAHGI
jgi:uncharacterized protein (UPF0248 family)